MVRHRILIVKEMQFCIDPFSIAQKINCRGGSHRIQDFGLTSSAARYFLIAFWSLTCCFGALIATQSLFYVIAASACCWKCDILIPSLSVYFFSSMFLYTGFRLLGLLLLWRILQSDLIWTSLHPTFLYNLTRLHSITTDRSNWSWAVLR